MCCLRACESISIEYLWTKLNSINKTSIKYKEFLPDYINYTGRCAPIMRNMEIVEYSDFIIIVWDGKSKGSKFVIDFCKKSNKNYKIILKDK